MKVWIKVLEDGSVFEAPKVYKNISNFNKAPSLMKKYGFVERIKGYLKSNGTLKYIEPDKWGQHKTFYTENPYQGDDYQWSDAIGGWELKLEKAKENKLREIRDATNEYMKQLKQGFSDAEMETWARQENGAKILSENPESEDYDAQWVRALATTRGISLEEQIQRIFYASNLMNTYAYQLVGYQQRLEDLVAKATTLEQILDINFSL